VSTRAVADGSVPIKKLSGTLILNKTGVSVPASGQTILFLREGNDHAFLLVSVVCEQATLFGAVDWHLRAVRRSFTNQRFQQIVLVNTQNTEVTVSCKAYRLNED
jgi:hypothetical protein